MESLESINTDITTYTIDDLFSLLDINVDKNSTPESVKKLIEEKSNFYIKMFTESGRVKLVNFFESIKKELIGNNVKLTIAEEELLNYENKFEPFKGTKGSTGNDMFNSNNGSGNPIHRKTVSKLLNIDSKFRANYLNNVIEIKFSDLELPISYYPFTTANQNNYFWFATYTEAQIITKTPYIYYFFMPEGNYSYDRLLNYLNDSFETIETMDISSVRIPIKVSYDLSFNPLNIVNGTGKLTFAIDASLNALNINPIVKVELNFKSPALTGPSKKVTEEFEKNIYYFPTNIPLTQRMSWMLGFRDTNYSFTTSLVTESVLNITGPRYLYIILEDFNKSSNINFLSSSKYGLLPDNILARVSLKGSAFNILSQNDFSVYAEPRYYYGPVNISKLRIKIVDEYARVLNLNSDDFSFTLRMTTVYSAT
jgi:hypothetical protein